MRRETYEFRIDPDTISFPASVLDVLDVDVLRPKEPRKTELGIETFKWRGRKGAVELAFGLAYRRTSGRPSFLEQGGSRSCLVHTAHTEECDGHLSPFVDFVATFSIQWAHFVSIFPALGPITQIA
jgi:hypothetical protein